MKTWFITGTSSGIGRKLTEQLLRRGDRVAATLRDPSALAALATEYGQQLWTATLDVTDASSVRAVVAKAFSELGQIDVVVNNAGYGLTGAGEEVSDAQIDRMIATNLMGSMHVIRAALKPMRAQGGGRILQISSEGGQVAYPAFSIYHASKWGIEGFVEAVAQEVAPFNISITIIEPGATRTNFGAAIVSAPAIDVYKNTPAGEVRRMIETRTFPVKGDPDKMARAMIDSLAIEPAPKRLAMSSSAYENIKRNLESRLAELEKWKDIALSTDLN